MVIIKLFKNLKSYEIPGKIGSRGWIFLLFSLLFACSASNKHSLNFDPLDPLKVAIIPFYQIDDSGEIINSRGNIFQTVNQNSTDTQPVPATQLEDVVYGELRRSALQIVPRFFTKAQFVHHGFSKNNSYDYERILKLTPVELGKLLDAEALLYGEILDWDQSYYGIQSVTSVGLSIKLIRVSDGKLLYESQVSDYDSRGISKGPTGYSSILLEPLKGLSEDVREDLAVSVAKKSIEPLLVESSTAYLESAAPVIYSAVHNSREGQIDLVKGLTVLATGSRGAKGSFSIGENILDLPMLEVSPGHFYGVYLPLKTDSFSNEVVSIRLKDRFGRVAEETIGAIRVSLNQ